MWNIKCFVILVINGAMKNVTTGLKISLNKSEKHSIDSLQKHSCTRDIAYNKESATI
jgi:hypothetical protein